MGLAYLPDGTAIDYREYVGSRGGSPHPHWTAVRRARLRFDGHQCAICHEHFDEGDRFETHHLSYMHLGNEHLRDVITLCPACHTKFHNNWQRQDFWKGREAGHWNVFDLEHTAKLCAQYYREDKLICKDPDAPNLCNKNIQRQYIDRYLKENRITTMPMIDPNDIGLFVRNKRYELFFEAESRGLSVEEFLDEYYGQKVRGKNPIRQEAGKKGGVFDHTPKSFHRHYKENKNLNLLMKEVTKYEEGRNQEAGEALL